jgi:hypothetical protein
MPIHRIRALCAGILLVCAASASAASSINVHVRVEGAHKTLVSERTLTLADAPVPPKDGNPDHTCPGQTALGALQQGSQGDWNGSYSEGLGYFVTTIKGEKPTGNSSFQLWVNHKEATAGFCDDVLKGGDDVLILVQTCTYNPTTMACPDTVSPLGVHVASSLKRGHHTTVTVVAYAPNGHSKAVKGAAVYANGHKLGTTDKLGHISVSGTKAGKVELYATAHGHVKSETETVRVH